MARPVPLEQTPALALFALRRDGNRAGSLDSIGIFEVCTMPKRGKRR